jgi:hypothetical protein
MTGKRYYITTLGDWQRHAGRFANSHFIVLDAGSADDSALDPCLPNKVVIPSESALGDNQGSASVFNDMPQQIPQHRPPAGRPRNDSADDGDSEKNLRILVLIEADEGVHLSLEDDAAFEALPHPLAQKPISDAAQAGLAPHGVAPGATTFDAAEAVARVHPLLRHRVF